MRYIVILSLLLIAANLSAFAPPTFAVKTVVIDAGHGGKDPGAIGANKTQEKNVALAVSLALGKKINDAYPEVRVLYTRSTDVFIPLVDRANFANKNKADLFISIHCNAAENRSVKGSSTYVLGLHKSQDNLDVAKRENAVIELEDNVDKNYDFNPNSTEGHIIMSMKQNAFLEQSIDVAARIEAELTGRKETSGSRGVKQAGFFVLYKTSMPSLLAEIGFISNPTEEMYLASKEGQDEIAVGLFDAFTGYKQHIERAGKPLASAAKDTASSQVIEKNNPPKIATPVVETEKVVVQKTEPAKKTAVKETPKPAEVKPEPKPVAVKEEPVKKEEPKPLPTKPEPVKKEESKPVAAKEEPVKNETPQQEPVKTEVLVVKETPKTAVLEKKEPAASGLVFKLQMFASAKGLKWYPQLTEAFGKIDVETLPNGINRFMTGNFATYEEAEKLKPKATENGYTDAFVIAYRNGERLDIAATRALKK